MIDGVGGLLGESQVWPSTQSWPPPSFLTLESILLFIIFASHLKQGRWLYIAGRRIARTSPPDSEGYSWHVCTRIPSKSLISEQPGMKTGILKMQFNPWTERTNLSGKKCPRHYHQWGALNGGPFPNYRCTHGFQMFAVKWGICWKDMLLCLKILRNPGHGCLTCFSQRKLDFMK